MKTAEVKIVDLLIQAIAEGPDALEITDRNGTIVYVNKKFLELTGYEANELLGQNPSMHSAGRTPPEIFRELWDTILSGQVWTGELLNKRKNGQEYWELISIAPVKEIDGSISHFVASWKDVTEKRNFEEKLKQSNVDLGRSNAELEGFANAASHDLQEPLAIVSMYLELLQRHFKENSDKDAKQFIKIANEGAKDCQNLIRGILEYAKIGKNKTPFKMTGFESILKSALSNLELPILESGAEITHDPLPKLMADRFQMLRLFQNLLSNALKYRGEEPLKIHISARRSDKEWIFSVKDNGIGIAPKDKDRIFEIFQRLHTKTEHPGAGIGLAICKKIVEYHGGKIWIHSENGMKETTFYFSLPTKVNPSEKTDDLSFPQRT